MDDRTNTFAGWALFSGIVALGLSSVSARHFLADKGERPEKMGYAIEGVVSSEGGAAAEAPIEARLASADPAKGEASFAKCKSCHTDAAGGPAGIGPNLWGVVGRGVASSAFPAGYSDDIKKVGGSWDWGKLDTWLKGPKAMAAGTKMTFAGLSDAQERANVIAYLNTQGSNKPLPAAPKADAKPAEGKDAAAAPAAGEASAAPAAAEPAKK